MDKPRELDCILIGPHELNFDGCACAGEGLVKAL
jgi:hypothetical protein